MSLKPIKLFIKGERLLEEALRSQSVNSLEESLMSGNMASFLNEEGSVAGDEAIAVLSQAIQEAEKELKTFGQKVQAVEGMDATIAALGAASKSLTDIALDKGPESLKLYVEPIKKAKKALADVAALQGIVANAAVLTQTALDKLMDDAGKEMPIGEWLDSKKEDTAVPDREKFKAGIKKAWKPPAGIMNALKDFAAGLFGGGGADYFGLTFDAFAEDLMKVKYSAFQAFAQSNEVKDAGQPDETDKIEKKLGDTISDEALKAIEDGETPKSWAAKDKGGKDAKSSTKSWADLAKTFASSIKDKDLQAFVPKYTAALQKDQKFQAAAKEFITMGESFRRNSLMCLLSEEIAYDILKKPAEQVAPERADDLATAFAGILDKEGIKVSNVPAPTEDPDAKVPEQEIEKAQAAAPQVAKSVAKEDLSPADAAAKFIDDWHSSMPPSMQKAFGKKRMEDLKGVINTEISGAADALQQKVQQAIVSWVDKQKSDETLPQALYVQQSRETKKLHPTFEESLPKAAAGVVAAIMKKQGESNTRLTTGMITRYTNAYMDKWVATKFGGLLSEALISPYPQPSHDETSYTEDDMVKWRWMKMAGLGGYK